MAPHPVINMPGADESLYMNIYITCISQRLTSAGMLSMKFVKKNILLSEEN